MFIAPRTTILASVTEAANLTNALVYLSSKGKLNPARIPEITKPTSREEAYYSE